MTDHDDPYHMSDIAELEALDHAPSEHNSWKPLNLNDLPEHPAVQPTLGRVGEIGLVYPGKRHVFSGPQESAKTLAAYAIGIQVIRDGGTLILIDFEMGAYEARGRLRDLGATPTELQSLQYLEPDQPASTERIRALLQLEPTLVIIDAAAGAYDLQGLDDNKRQDVGKITRLYVEQFWRAGIATLFIDHVVKNAEARGNYAIGSERKIAGVDVHLGFEVITPISRGHNGLYKIVTRKDRGGYLKRGTLAELELTSDPETHAIGWTFRAVAETPEGETWLPTKVMEKISGLLEQQTEPVSANTMATLAGGNRPVALKAIGHLVRLGYATETPGPRSSKLLESTRRFTVREWENQPDPPLVPTGTRLVPGTGHSLVPTGSPPYRGNGTGEPAHEPPPVPDFQPHFGDWLDELTPEPTSSTDDDLPR